MLTSALTDVFSKSFILPAAVWKEEMASSKPAIVCRSQRVPIWE